MVDPVGGLQTKMFEKYSVTIICFTSNFTLSFSAVAENKQFDKLLAIFSFV